MVQMLLDDGYRVVVTDYMGLGTDGLHTYLNRVDQGHALIDAARATAKPHEKVAFWGYSQGGGAAAVDVRDAVVAPDGGDDRPHHGGVERAGVVEYGDDIA